MSPIQGLNSGLLGEIKLEGEPIPARIGNSIQSCHLERTIEGASTLEMVVRDPERFLQKGNYFNRAAEVFVDGLWFRACTFTKKIDEYTMIFEDRDVAILREFTKPRSGLRSHETRAQFLKRLVNEAPHIEFVSPELKVRQPVESQLQAATVSRATGKLKATKSRKISAYTNIRIEGQPLDADQIQNINVIIDVCERPSPSPDPANPASQVVAPASAVLAIMMAAVAESKLHTHALNPKEHAEGVFQVIPSTARSTGVTPTNTGQVAEYWLNTGFTGRGGGIQLASEGKTPEEICVGVEGGPGPEFYAPFRKVSEEIIRANGTGLNIGATVPALAAYKFTRGEPKGPKNENTWECGLRIAKEVNWRFFMVAGVVYYISDNDLIRTAPQMFLEEKSKGIESINWEIDKQTKKNPAKVTIEARADVWTAPPGTVIVLGPEQGEEVAGAWIVNTVVRKEITENAIEVTCHRPEEPKIEPAASVAPKATTVTATADGGVNAGEVQQIQTTGPTRGQLKYNSIVEKARRTAQYIAMQQYPYVYGGGHTKPFQASAGTTPGIGLDCSGAVSWVLHAAEILPALSVPPYAGAKTIPASREAQFAYTTANLQYWGEEGEGQWMTVWVRQEPFAGHEHTYMQFNEYLFVPGNTLLPAAKNVTYFVAREPGTIVGFFSSEEKEHFKPRRWPGT